LESVFASTVPCGEALLARKSLQPYKPADMSVRKAVPTRSGCFDTIFIVSDFLGKGD
jgi:hypothetical protein